MRCTGSLATAALHSRLEDGCDAQGAAGIIVHVTDLRNDGRLKEEERSPVAWCGSTAALAPDSGFVFVGGE